MRPPPKAAAQGVRPKAGMVNWPMPRGIDRNHILVRRGETHPNGYALAPFDGWTNHEVADFVLRRIEQRDRDVQWWRDQGDRGGAGSSGDRRGSGGARGSGSGTGSRDRDRRERQQLG